jgi:hypothetical protein
LPFPKTWTEELILEWLQLEGYLALSNVRLKSGKGGGVKEADIIGLKLRQRPDPQSKTMVEVLEVLHIEVGSLAMKFEKALKSVLEKFAKEREEAIRSLAMRISMANIVSLSNFFASTRRNAMPRRRGLCSR